MLSKNNYINKRWIVLVISISILSSCSKDFLDVVPVDRIPKEEFFKTEADLTSAVYGIYAAQRNLYVDNELGLYNLEETQSDNTNQIYGLQTEHRAVDNFTVQSGNTSITGTWASAYYAINLCNAVVDRGPAIDMDETTKAQLIGEALFVRACIYFQLVQDYGAIPLRVKETVTLAGDNNMTRTSVDSVYTQIVADLQLAASTLPASYSGTAVGRATSYAANALLGKVSLQHGDPASAVTALRKVVFTGSPYSLLPNYADLWNPANKNSAESIFEIQFLPPLDGSPYWNYFAPASLNVPGGQNRSVAPNTPNQDLIDEYESGDTRLAASIGIDPNNRPYILKFKDPGVIVGNDASNDIPVLRYADAILLLAEALGETGEAYDLINTVRSRAHLGPIDASTPGTFIHKLMHERRVELAFELQRWHDLHRLPEAETISIMNANLAEVFPGLNITMDSHSLIAPIPNTELGSNKLATQNPGYVQ